MVISDWGSHAPDHDPAPDPFDIALLQWTGLPLKLMTNCRTRWKGLERCGWAIV